MTDNPEGMVERIDFDALVAEAQHLKKKTINPIYMEAFVDWDWETGKLRGLAFQYGDRVIRFD